MQRVLVVDTNREPLMPCHPARARKLIKSGRASILRRYPFTIILHDREGGAVQPVAFKVDPGSRTSGIALVADFQRGKRVVWAANLHHRGSAVRDALLSRRQLRRGRRSRKTRYRPARFMNRRRPEGWLPPSLESRIQNIMTWAARLYRWSPLCAVSMELVKFDTQALENPEINGVQYQQGELVGYEVREYLLEKWGRKCAYCGAKDIPLEIEHVVPKSRGGSNRVSNLTLACTPCNQKKGNQTAAEFGYPAIQGKAKQPLKDAAAVNASRWALWRRFKAAGLPLEPGTGGRTKYNRRTQGYPKAHWIDAACVGVSGEQVRIVAGHVPLEIKAVGRGRRQMCQVDKYGFPRINQQGQLVKRSRHKVHPEYGIKTGDICRAILPTGKYAGRYVGRVTIRSKPAFTINGVTGHAKHFTVLYRGDGYAYPAPTQSAPQPAQSDTGHMEWRKIPQRRGSSAGEYHYTGRDAVSCQTGLYL